MHSWRHCQRWRFVRNRKSCEHETNNVTAESGAVQRRRICNMCTQHWKGSGKESMFHIKENAQSGLERVDKSCCIGWALHWFVVLLKSSFFEDATHVSSCYVWWVFYRDAVQHYYYQEVWLAVEPPSLSQLKSAISSFLHNICLALALVESKN